jgi:hypothetical protein
MKIVKAKPKCAICGTWKVNVHCNASMLNGCDMYFCFLDWPDHAKIHDAQWDKLTDKEKDEMIKRYI